MTGKGKNQYATAYNSTAYKTTACNSTAYKTTACNSTAYSTTAYNSTAYSTTAYNSTAYKTATYNSTAYSTTAYNSACMSIGYNLIYLCFSKQYILLLKANKSKLRLNLVYNESCTVNYDKIEAKIENVSQ